MASVSLREAITDTLRDRGGVSNSNMNFTVAGLHAQLQSRWRHAAAEHAASQSARPTGKLPREDAAAKMATWIPWAIREINIGIEGQLRVLRGGGDVAAA